MSTFPPVPSFSESGQAARNSIGDRSKLSMASPLVSMARLKPMTTWISPRSSIATWLSPIASLSLIRTLGRRSA
jgi:hypothetical protein